MGAGALFLRNEPRCLPVPGFELRNGAFICGRLPHCDLILPHSTVSRCHAELHVTDLKVEVVDLASRNGTFINGRRIDRDLLYLRDVLCLGKVSFVLSDDARGEDDCDPCVEVMSTLEVRASPISLLSDAQRRVLDLVVEGLVEKQIAKRLKISPHTAHNHVRNIYRALDVHSRAELLARLK